MSTEAQLGATMDVVTHDSARLDEVWATLHFVVVPSLARLDARLSTLQTGMGKMADNIASRFDSIGVAQQKDRALLVAIARALHIEPED